jgi:hypothetical protein
MRSVKLVAEAEQRTVSRPVCLGVKFRLRRKTKCLLLSDTVVDLLMWGALSQERTGLSFTISAGPRKRSHSRVLFPQDYHILLPLIRNFPNLEDKDPVVLSPRNMMTHLTPYRTAPFLWPPTTHRATVDIYTYSNPPPQRPLKVIVVSPQSDGRPVCLDVSCG